MAEQRSKTRAKRFRSVIAKTKAACHICGLPIDYSLPYTEAMSFVVDHVIPLHKGGSDTIDNARAAHKLCNSKKRARIVAPIIRRSGSLG